MVWNEPGKGPRDPWNKNRRDAGKNPAWSAVLKNLNQYLGKLGGGHGGPFVIVLILVLVWFALGSYTVIAANQSGVVLRLGRYERTLTPGFHLKLPQPIESVRKVATTDVRSLSDQARMLTSDENIILVNFNVQYQVSDPRRFLFSTRDAQETLREAAEAAVRAVVGAHSMDDILTGMSDNRPLTAAKTAHITNSASVVPAQAEDGTLQQQTRDILQHTLDSYHIGLQINDISFQKVAPPQEVRDAFDDVNAAREDKQGSENKARAYASKVIPKAHGDAARILAEAAAYKASRIAHAQGATEQFNLLWKQYKVAPEVTRQRLWLETMERVLANHPKVIDGSAGRSIINLPALSGRGLSKARVNVAVAATKAPPPSISGVGKEKLP